MGPPGAGKGTQAKRLAEKFGMDHLSSGDIFRAETDGGSPLSAKLAEYMSAGRLVPDDIVVAVMAKAIADSGAAAGLLLDGFPRTVAQAEALDDQLAQARLPLDAVVIITAGNQAIVERITGRRSCQTCGQAYHVRFLPPEVDNVCDKCGAELSQREDDTETVVRQRLDAYNERTQPAIAYYRGQLAVNVIEIDGEKSPDAVTAAMVCALDGLKASV